MFKSIEELREYRKACKQALESEKKKIIVCGGAGCVSKGANKVYNKLISLMEESYKRNGVRNNGI